MDTSYRFTTYRVTMDLLLGTEGYDVPVASRHEDKEGPFVTMLGQHPIQSCTAQPVPRPRGEDQRPARDRFRQRVVYHDSGTAALVVGGAVDAGTAPRFDEMLRSRLCTELARLVLDLSGLEFLGLAGVSVLIEADLRARHTHTELLLRCGHNRQVTRVLTATAEHHQL